MSLGSSKPQPREEAIEATRRRLRRLEIETHRIKAELARLEAEYEDDVADRLSRKLRRRSQPAINDERVDVSPATTTSSGTGGSTKPAVLPFGRPSTAAAKQPRVAAAGVSDRGSKFSRHAAPAPQIVVESETPGMSAHRGTLPRSAAAYRKNASPLLLSLALHVVALFFCISFTFATLVQQDTPLLASPADLDETIAEDFSEVEIETTKFDDVELQNVVADSPEFNIADNDLNQFDPAALGAGAQPLGDIGQLDALPSELGTLMAGAGAPGGGQPGGPLGSAVFFGARSKGDRFVFVVDNSSSMKGGRLDAAIAEIVKSVDALSPRQTFYVIFVSDQTYPMFYPEPAPDLLPATAPNKKRLAEWLPKAILASGNNRQLIKAMDMAAALRPHTVFLLWDGDLKYSDKVRLEVMTHLTQPNDWAFTIHTLGMGVSSLDSQQNLTMIAEAHGGAFRRVDVPPAPPR